MAGHQAVGEQPHVVTGDRLGQDPLERLVIVVGLEDGQAGGASVEGMVDQAAFGRRSGLGMHSR